MLRLCSVLLLVFLTMACGNAPAADPAPETTPPETTAPDPAAPDAEQPAEQPADGGANAGAEGEETITETVQLEGTEESITLVKYTDEGIGFTTYVPEDIEPSSASSGEGDAFFATANFGGTREPRAVFYLFAPAEEMTKEKFVDYSHELKRQEGFEIAPYAADAPRRFAGSFEEYGIHKTGADGTIVGSVALIEANGRMVQITIQYPEDYEEGFVPRAMKIYEHMHWKQ
ncbi:hypothetical protein [Paenibacillus sp.]|uniref:hypothetical protein n=1 Tax=Paenibacillus sp. TaxID=58172 RepID=UPI002D587C6B|nr:hypothetical protein [Paenibacillus sp.]HZG85665.1 hypothetical protein [Paenibacillus sp.]